MVITNNNKVIASELISLVHKCTNPRALGEIIEGILHLYDIYDYSKF